MTGTPRPIVAMLHPKSSNDPRRVTRRYSKIDNAVPRLVQLAMKEGRVGDVVEVFHDITSLQLGTIRMKANGTLDIKWIWEE